MSRLSLDNRRHALTLKHSLFLVAFMFPLLMGCCLFQEPDVGLENSGDVLVLTSVTRKDSGIYQCRPQDADATAEVRGDMQLAVHCEEDTQKLHST